MALIKCSHCGHGVLSVATQCPKCAVPLRRTFELGGSGELAECRRCGHAVLSNASACANCGAGHPARSYTRGIVVATMALVAISGWVIMALTKEHSQTQSRSSLSLVTRAIATPADSKSAELRSPPARLIFVAPADSKQVTRPADVRPLVDTARPTALAVSPPAPASDSSSAAQPKVVAGWANVREEPSGDAAVVKVLRPGQQVEVVQRRGGWWAVYADGRRLGYVSRSLLAEQAPGANKPVTN